MKLDDLAAKLIKLDNDIKYLVSASRFDSVSYTHLTLPTNSLV